MLRTEATQLAAESVKRAIGCLENCKVFLGGVHRDALNDGMVREIVRQITKVGTIAMELRDMNEAIDYPIDDETTIGPNVDGK